jgi:hypothetical protein
MEVRQALADLAEVRGRLAGAQRFEGYSGQAAVQSGVAAIAAGVLQWRLAPHPQPAQHGLYLTIWLVCLGVALSINYGAILAWRMRNRSAYARAQMRTVGITILPAIAAGGVLTAALAMHDLFYLLPGTWCAIYALGLFASRAMVPPKVTGVAVIFGAAAAALLLVPGIDPLAWWIMPITFGAGQIAIGAIVGSDPLRSEKNVHDLFAGGNR